MNMNKHNLKITAAAVLKLDEFAKYVYFVIFINFSPVDQSHSKGHMWPSDHVIPRSGIMHFTDLVV